MKEIQTDADHARAAAELHRLMGAEPGTVEFDRLYELVIAVECYERKRWPTEPASHADIVDYYTDQSVPPAEAQRRAAALSRQNGDSS
jgi:antitoxin component HigA of HigAB toxin-antitoxin module